MGVTSSNSGANSQMVNNQNQQYSSAAWRAHEFLQLMGYNGNGGASNTWLNGNSKHIRNGANEGTSSDCSLCANIDRKYQCIWCQNQCQHRDSCLDGHQITIGSSGCPPPGIDSVSFHSLIYSIRLLPFMPSFISSLVTIVCVASRHAKSATERDGHTHILNVV